MKITLGKAGNHSVTLDLPLLLSTRMLLTADSGGGKTHALKLICEKVFGKMQIIVVDPEGEFAPLRTKFDFLLAGPGGETPADTRSARLLGLRLLETRASAICDLYEMNPRERHEWVRLFLEGLIEAPKKLRHPCLVIVDEAHIFCPERGKGESTASEMMIALCTRGRKRLLCALFATQRLATLSKDASSMLLNRMIGPTFEDVNRKRAAEVLSIAKEEHGEFLKQIQVLEPGYFYALGRAITKERVLLRVGGIATPHGEEALKYETAPPPPLEKVKALMPKLADLPKQAEEKARTEADLRKEIRELKAQLRAQPAAAPKVTTRVVTDEKAVRQVVLKLSAAYAAHFAKHAQVLGRLRKAMESTGGKIQEALQHTPGSFAAETDGILELKRQLTKGGVREVAPRAAMPAGAGSSPAPAVSRIHETVKAADNGQPSELTPQQQRILAGLAEWEGLGQSPIPRSWVGAAAGQSFKSSTFEKYVARLRSLGYIEYAAGARVALSDTGRAIAPPIETPLDTDEIQRRCLALLTPQQQGLLQALIAEHPHFISREELGAKASQSHLSSTFEKYLAALRSGGMVEYGPNKTVKCADWLFIE